MVFDKDLLLSVAAEESFKTSLSRTVRMSVIEGQFKRVFDALADGGSVFMPLGETFWSPCFGMVTDRFGISWMVTTPEMK